MNISNFLPGIGILLSLAVAIYLMVKGNDRRIAEQAENDAVAKIIDTETDREIFPDKTAIPFALYLRPFGLERYIRRPRKWVPFDASKPLSTPDEIDFDYFLQEHYHEFGLHLICLDPKGKTPGAGRIVTDDERWFIKFCKLAHDAEVIVIVPGISDSALQEIRWLTEKEFLDKTIFLKPEGFPHREWEIISDYFREDEGMNFPPYSPLLMSFRINNYGRYHNNETWKEISGYYDLNWYREQMMKILLK